MKNNAALARKVALSCRILAKLGLFKETTGHVSARNGKDQMLIRGRGPRETGLLFTKPSDVLLADFEGQSQERKAGLNRPMKPVFMAGSIRPGRKWLAWSTLTRRPLFSVAWPESS